MVAPEAQQTKGICPRCTLCPACCPLSVVPAGPDSWRTECPLGDDGGLCPRGSVLGELLGHRRRILTPIARGDGESRRIGLDEAARRILDAASGGSITFMLDSNLPIEQIARAIDLCGAWPDAKLCFALEPAERQLLLGIEASGAEYVGVESLADCDGFLMIGDVFGADPVCARGVFDRRKAQPRTPIVVIDPAFGTASKFATHSVPAAAGGELAALTAVAAAAGVQLKQAKASGANAGAEAAGAALAACKKPAVLIAAEYGRSGSWRQVGYVAGLLARKLGGRVAPQTTGANALASLRLGGQAKAVSLASAMSDESKVRVALGVDVLGMLGWTDGGDGGILAAAAALGNTTTQAARIVLPTTMPGETAGTYLASGSRSVTVEPVLPAPAGVPTPAGIIASLARAAGIAASPSTSAAGDATKPLTVEAPRQEVSQQDAGETVLLLGRQAIQAGCGDLTGWGSWQAALQPLAPLRMSPAEARDRGLKNLAVAEVTCGRKTVKARVHVLAEMPSGVVVLPESDPCIRSMAPAVIDSENDTIVATPADVNIRSLNGND